MIKKCDIVLIQFPFTDLTSQKVRPALVVSSNQYNNKSQDALFLLITTNTKNQFFCDYLVDASHPEFPGTGLRYPSLFKCDRLVTLSQSIAQRRLGVAGNKILESVERMLLDILDLQDKERGSVMDSKIFEYKGVKYEIRFIKRPDGTWFLKAFKNGNPFTPYYYGIDSKVDFSVMQVLDDPAIDYLVQQAEDDVKWWVDNSDKI